MRGDCLHKGLTCWRAAGGGLLWETARSRHPSVGAGGAKTPPPHSKRAGHPRSQRRFGRGALVARFPRSARSIYFAAAGPATRVRALRHRGALRGSCRGAQAGSLRGCWRRNLRCLSFATADFLGSSFVRVSAGHHHRWRCARMGGCLCLGVGGKRELFRRSSGGQEG